MYWIRLSVITFLFYAVLDLKIPKSKACYITTRSYKSYNAEQFFPDISHIPWNTIDLMDSLDEKVDGFSDLFLACLNDHAPVKTIKVKRKSIPFITDDIRKMIAARNNLHRIAGQSRFLSDWNAFKQQRCKVKLALKKAETEYYNPSDPLQQEQQYVTMENDAPCPTIKIKS